MHTSLIADRVAAFRAWMRTQQLDVFIVPSTDPHNSEYPAEHWKCREWINGFDGSAGVAAISLTDAALWTDSRYFLQAEQQLANTPFSLMRDGLAETPSLSKWIDTHSPTFENTLRVGFVADTMNYVMWNNDLAGNTTLIACNDVFKTIWTDRPPLPKTLIWLQHLKYVGLSPTEKFEKLRSMSTEDWDFYVVNDLSEIAWLLNIRGRDFGYNPLFLSYLIIRRSGGATLFVDDSRMPPEVRDYLTLLHHVEIRPYDGIDAFLQEYNPNDFTYRFDENISVGLFFRIFERLKQDEGNSAAILAKTTPLHLPISELRAAKNADEIKGFRRAMLQDGVALVKFRRWLDEVIEHGDISSETEYSVAQRLYDFRAEEAEFESNSFATIAGYGANGAIVHYEPTATHHAPLRPEGLLLLDSGAQYLSGTTDITRTIALGKLTDEERRVYTLVLKGHIALSQAHFPKGTLGIQLDLAARYAMWQHGYDFGHGTGHGVGAHLCVHEGPQQIRKNLRQCTQVPFVEGMTITNEPGIYVSGKFGVRIENILLVSAAESTDFGQFYCFEPLTLCPIDISPIDFTLLTTEEVVWLNAYHASVREKLLPLLSDAADREWLLTATAEQPLRS